MSPYYSDEWVSVYHGDCRTVVPVLPATFACVVADPPYGETALPWDQWPAGWPGVMAGASSAMWCFGSVRMFLDRRSEFATWQLSQDIVWEKHTNSGARGDRFMRVHEHALFWYRGLWRDVTHDTPREGQPRQSKVARPPRPSHFHAPDTRFTYTDDGTRLQRSIIRVASMRGRASHGTEKPVGILDPLIRYATTPGDMVLDPFGGSGSTGEAARLAGRRAVLVEADERYCEVIAQRMSQSILDTEPTP